jgi:hypothetical protein
LQFDAGNIESTIRGSVDAAQVGAMPGKQLLNLRNNKTPAGPVYPGCDGRPLKDQVDCGDLTQQFLQEILLRSHDAISTQP